MKIRIAIAEDDPLTRKQYGQRFSFYKQIEIVALAENGMDLIEKIRALRPDLIPDMVLMDIEMPVLSGIEATAMLRQEFPDIDVMMLTVFFNDEKIFQSIQAGASGYLLKDCSTDELVQSIEELHEGGVPLARSIARKVLQFMRTDDAPIATPGPSDSPPGRFELTPREIEVLEEIVKDEKEFAIAQKLSISPATVHTHVKNIYRKLEVHSRGGVVKAALMNRLVSGRSR